MPRHKYHFKFRQELNIPFETQPQINKLALSLYLPLCFSLFLCFSVSLSHPPLIAVSLSLYLSTYISTCIYIYKYNSFPTISLYIYLSLSLSCVSLTHSLSVNNSTQKYNYSRLWIHTYYTYVYMIYIYIYILNYIYFVCFHTHTHTRPTHIHTHTHTYGNNCLQYTFARYFYNASELYIVISNLCFFPAYKQILNTYRSTRNIPDIPDIPRYRIHTQTYTKNNKPYNANENEIRIPAHLYAPHTCRIRNIHKLINMRTWKQMKKHYSSNGRTAREGVPTHIHTYPTNKHTHTHLHCDPAAWLSLSLKVTHI